MLEPAEADPVRPPTGCTDPERWLDAYLIAVAHRAVGGVCACGRPLPCIAAQRADEVMDSTMRAAREAEAIAARAAREAASVAAAHRAFSEAVTQDLPIIRIEDPDEDAGPVGARFPRPRRRDREPDTDDWTPSTTGGWPAVAMPEGGIGPGLAPPPSTGWTFPPPAVDPTPTGARFPRDRRSSRHRA